MCGQAYSTITPKEIKTPYIRCTNIPAPSLLVMIPGFSDLGYSVSFTRAQNLPAPSKTEGVALRAPFREPAGTPRRGVTVPHSTSHRLHAAVFPPLAPQLCAFPDEMGHTGRTRRAVCPPVCVLAGSFRDLGRQSGPKPSKCGEFGIEQSGRPANPPLPARSPRLPSAPQAL